MRKQAQYSYKGINQDITKSKRPPEFYFDANNIRTSLNSEDSQLSVTTEKGNTLIATLPTYQNIIGSALLNEYLVLFSTNDETYEGEQVEHIDQITTLKLSDYTLNTIYSDNLNFSISNPIETVVGYENESIQKVYWVDGINQLRFINIMDASSLEGHPELLDVVPSYKVGFPELESKSFGGTHTAGVIQYAYNLIKKNGQQTAVSPFSELTPLKKSRGGGEVNEIVGQINNIIIKGVDTKFDIIRVYAIKYTSYNQTPTVSLIAEENASSTVFRYSDDGRIIYNTSLEEILFLGAAPIIPGTIESKKNRLVLGNITEEYFDINTNLPVDDDNYFDTRAFRFKTSGLTTEIKNKDEAADIVSLDIEKGFVIGADKIKKDHDCISNLFSQETVIDSTETTDTSTVYNVTDKTEHFPTMGEYPDGANLISILIETPDQGAVDAYSKTLNFDLEDITTMSFKEQVVNYLNQSSWTVDIKGPTYTYRYEVNAEYKLAEDDVVVALRELTFSNEDLEEGLPMDTIIDYVNQDMTCTVVTYTSTVTTTGEEASLYTYDRTTEGLIYGATGDNIELKILQVDLEDKIKLLKSNEIYRFGIEFYNKYGQRSQPHWIADLKIPQGNLNGDCNILDVTISNTDKLINQGVVGWRILRVERTEQDKSIMFQGLINPSFYQYYNETVAEANPGLQATANIPAQTLVGIDYANEGTIKMPSTFLRTYGTFTDSVNYDKVTDSNMTTAINIEQTTHGYPIAGRSVNKDDDTSDGKANDPRFEVYRTWDAGAGESNAITHLETRLNFIYSPELTFLAPIVSEQLKCKINHFVSSTISNTSVWGKQYSQDTQLEISSVKINGTFTLFFNAVNTGHELHQNGKIGGGGRSLYHNYQYYRKLNFTEYAVDNSWNISGTPTIIGSGESNVIYDSNDITTVDSRYKVSNNLFTVVTDSNVGEEEDEDEQPLLSVNSIGNKALITVLEDEVTLEHVLDNSSSIGTPAFNEIGVAEVTRVLSNQYGGDTYEARGRNTYLNIGKYYTISASKAVVKATINNAGDTYVNTFSFCRLLPNVAEVFSAKYLQYTEIVDVPLETSIDLSARDDVSISGWDSVFQPQFNDYHSYNRVYSQEPLSTANTANPFTFDVIKYFPTKILSTKSKTAGELIDSWTDVLVNEELSLDGQYGKLQLILSLNDKVIALQEHAVASLQIQPRIQQVTSDGLGVELGTGQVLYNYNYITTSSGLANKRAAFTSPSSVYYLDLANSSFNRISSEGLMGLSDHHGLHSYLVNNLDYSAMRGSNDIHGAYDKINNEAYLVVKDSFCLTFNELENAFKSFYSGYKGVNMIIPTYSKLLSTEDNNELWEHFSNDYGVFYGNDPIDSSITLLCAPNPTGESIFTNLDFICELRDSNGDDVFFDGSTYTIPFTKLKIFNDYQDSQDVNTTYKSNVYRKFRNWSIQLPRDFVNKRDRIRGKWAKITLTIDNSQNNTMVLHDMILTYNEINPIR